MRPGPPLPRSAARLRRLVLPLLTAVLALALGASTAPAAKRQAAAPDPLLAKQWAPQQVRAPQAWATTTGAGVTVAIVDSGVDFDHPDLKSKLLQGATFLGCGTTSCGNGDWESGPADRQAVKSTHGTHVAGIAAATRNNGLGIAGVAPDATILPVKVLDEDGGSFEDIGAGIRYAADNGADVINLSLGALPGAQALTLTGLIADARDAVAYARGRGVTVVAAAGNDFASICGTPAFEAGALCVASTDKRELRSAFSNFAIKPDLDTVSGPGGSLVPACGEDVVSTVPLGTGASATCGYGTDYDELAGTSMATPAVAGVAALLAARGRSDDDVVATLKATARKPASDVRGVWDPSYGYGIVDAQAALAAPAG